MLSLFDQAVDIVIRKPRCDDASARLPATGNQFTVRFNRDLDEFVRADAKPFQPVGHFSNGYFKCLRCRHICNYITKIRQLLAAAAILKNQVRLAIIAGRKGGAYQAV